MIKKIQVLVVLLLVTAFTNLFAQTSTVYFYRLKSIYLANTNCIIAVNDTAKFTIGNGTYNAIKTSAPTINMITSLNNSGLKNLTLVKGKTYYIEVTLQTPNSATLTLKDEFTGKPAIERLQADEKVKEMKVANLNTIKVTTVAPLPAASEGLATVYLFRPFNVAGVNQNFKVSDGENLYEMKNNSSYVITTSSKNQITFTTMHEGGNTSNTSLTLKLEKGKVYYVSVLRSGGAILLNETKEDYAKKEMKL